MAIDPTLPGSIEVTPPLTGDEVVEVIVGPVFTKTTAQDIANLAPGGPIASGTVTLDEDTPVTVANTAVTANSIIIFTLKTVGGTVGAYPAIQTITAGTGFTVAGTTADTSVYNYRIEG